MHTGRQASGGFELPLHLGDEHALRRDLEVAHDADPASYLGLTDAIRAVSDEPGRYTFWDYQAGAWQKNNGIRIDHLLLSPEAADRVRSVAIDKDMRGRDKASDHTPIRVDLAL